MAGPEHGRVEVLHQLLDLEKPVDDALEALSEYPWDSDELVTVTRAHVATVLDQYASGALSDAQVVRWSEVVHLRDDIGRAEGDEDLINELLIEMSSPELFGALEEIAPELARRLGS